MPRLDRSYVDEVCSRLERLAPDARPLWGKMSQAQLLGHLNAVVRYTMGQGPRMPFRGNAVSRYIFGPLVRAGIVAIPRNVKLPRPEGMKERSPMPEGTLEDLRVTLDAYLNAFEQGQLAPCVHPFFGMMPPRQWNKFHVRHFEHHLKQFGV
jgi:hypothetical protein